MFTDWRELPLPQILDFQEGPGIMARDFRPDGVPLIRLAGLKRGAPLLAGCDRLDEEQVSKRWNHFRLLRGDVLLSTSASLGETATVDDSGVGAIAYTGIIRFRPKSSEILAKFIPHALTAPSFKRQIEAMGVGSVIKHFGPTHLRQMTIHLPPVSHQQAITEVLGALDDKIAVNERIANTSVQLGGELLELAVQTHSYESTVGSIAELVYGKALPEPKRRHGDAPVYGCTGQVGWHDTPLTASPIPVVGRKGANAGHVSWMPRPGWVIDTAYYARPLTSEISAEALYFVLNSAGLKKLIGDSAVPGINRDLALRQPVRLPEPGFMVEFRERARYLLETRVHKKTENRALTDLRDTLLPQLVTGKLRIKDAERAVEDAV